MTTSTCVGRRRDAARLTLLSLTTALCSGLAVSASAQSAPPSAPVRQSVEQQSAATSAAPSASTDTSDGVAGAATAPASSQKAGGAGAHPNACDGCGGTPTPTSAGDITPPAVYTVTPTGVNIADRGFTYTNTDLSIGSLSLERFWLGGSVNDPNTPFFGKHMSNNFDIYFKEHEVYVGGPTNLEAFRAVVHFGNSASGTYDINFSVSPRFISPNQDDAASGILEFVSGAYVYTDASGTVYTFDPNVTMNGASGDTHRVSTIAYANGRTLTFSYDSGHNLKLVSSNDGYAIAFDYSGNTVTSACGYNTAHSIVSAGTGCGGASLKTNYGYSSGLMTSYSDVLGQVTQYGYAGQEISCITPPSYSSCKIANEYEADLYSPFFHVTKQTLADGGVWMFTGSSPNTRDPDFQPEDGDAGVSVQDPLHQNWQTYTSFTFAKSSPHTYTDMLGRTTQYTYGGGPSYDYAQSDYTAYGTLLKQVILPEGNEYDAGYDPSHFNLVAWRKWKAKPGSGLADVSQTFSYPDCATSGVTRQQCVHPNAITDANGNTTNWSYTSFGMPEWEMQPAPMAGAARPLKLYAYVQKYAYVQNGAGQLAASGGPIWMPASETQCQTVAGSSSASCDAGAPQETTTYEYGADGTVDNLLVRGKLVSSGGVSLRTCYRYDGQGNKIAETSPRAGLASCPA